MTTAATLFSGIGAPETARPDWRWLWSAEIEPFPSAVLAARHPGSVNLGDVTAHDFADRALAIGRPDVLVFGSPCQSFSVAGKRLGLDDPRGNLAFVALAVVRRVRPRWLVFENVPGLLSSGGGDDFAAFLAAVQECGYLGCWRVLDARHWGLAQRRQRVFFVGCVGDWRGPAEVLSFAEGLRGYPETGREAGQRVAGTLEASLGRRCGQPNDHDPAGGLISFMDMESHSSGDNRDVAPTMKTGDCGRISVAYACQGSNVGEAGTLRGGNGGLTGGVPFMAVDLQNCALGGEVSGTLDTTSPSRGGGQAVMAFQERGREDGPNVEYQTELAYSLNAPAGGGRRQELNIAHAAAVRRLTPVECERLQGFPDGWTNVIYRGKPAADGNRYRALGNAMAVPVVRWILTRLEQVDRAIQVEADRAA